MKLRLTKGRIACAVVLFPVLYVLNVGPLVYLTEHGAFSPFLLIAMYDPIYSRIERTPMQPIWNDYVNWWAELPPGE